MRPSPTLSIPLAGVLALAGCAAPTGDGEPMVLVEPAGVMARPGHVDLRAGVVPPPPEVIVLDGATYSFALVPAGGNFPYVDAGGAPLHADVVLVGGTEDKLAAVDVFLAACHPGRAREDVWGDEYIPRERVTGAWLFEYPDGCPARGSVPAA